MDGFQNTGLLKFGTVEGYHYIAELLAKNANAVFHLKVVVDFLQWIISIYMI